MVVPQPKINVNINTESGCTGAAAAASSLPGGWHIITSFFKSCIASFSFYMTYSNFVEFIQSCFYKASFASPCFCFCL